MTRDGQGECFKELTPTSTLINWSSTISGSRGQAPDNYAYKKMNEMVKDESKTRLGRLTVLPRSRTWPRVLDRT